MKNITITEKDYLKALPKLEGKKYKHTFSPSGMLIDELAYCAGQWTSEDLYENNIHYEPNEPYSFDYENDLFSKTKTLQALKDISNKLDFAFEPSTLVSGRSNLQAGAFIALNYPEQWQKFLKAYTEKLKEDRTDGISEAYNKALQEELDDYHNNLHHEWLHGDRDYAGVVYEIAKYFTNERDGVYTPYNSKTKEEASYTFTLNEQDMEDAKDAGYNKNQLKSYLLDKIISSGQSREYKDKQQREARKVERERLQAYKKEQAEKAEAQRREKLLAMKQ